MPERPVLIELAAEGGLAEAADAALALTGEGAAPADVSAVPKLAGVKTDAGFAPTQIPGQRARERSEDVYDLSAAFDVTTEPEESTYVVRAYVDEDKAVKTAETLRKRAAVVGVYADPRIEPTIVCPGSAAVGTDTDVERLLCTSRLQRAGADGTGVRVAIVDTGVNVAYLNSRGKSPSFDAARSWAHQAGLTPGSMPVDHGTMCAYDVCIAAPRCSLLDIALLRPFVPSPTGFAAFLSDAVRAYRHLIDVMSGPHRPGANVSLVVNNSWGMFDPGWDFPVGDPGNYSDNPNHPFNRIVATLERAGADILFAAGNCGPDCPDGRCQGNTANAIYGANGHPAVLCVAGVDTTKARVGYSTVGPGRLTANKPDISGYTHFRGSGVYAADGGTSAATPVVAGVVAAMRSTRPYDQATSSTHPAAIRNLMTSSAEDLGAAGYDLAHGYGVVNGCALAFQLRPRLPEDLCRRYPWLCRPVPIDLCRRYPWLCRPFPIPSPPFPPGPDPPGPAPPIEPPAPLAAGEALASAVADWSWSSAAPAANETQVGDLAPQVDDPVALSYALGYYNGREAATHHEVPAAPSRAKGDCDCNN